VYTRHYVCVSERSGSTSFISSLELCTTVVVRSAVTGPDSSRVLSCHAADKHDTPPSNFKLTLGQPALLWAFNGKR